MEYSDHYRRNKVYIVMLLGFVLVFLSFLINIVITAIGEGSDEIACSS